MKKTIELQNVTKEYTVGNNKLLAANDISFSINEGEFVIILGPSGAGKSTILNLLGGMDSATDGKIIIDGTDISHFNDKQLTNYRAEKVGFVFQFYNLIPTLTAYENVKITKDIVSNSIDAKEILELVGLKDHINKFPSQLSGGEQQRVSIARAVAKNPTMLLCDEPTGALDSETGILVLELLQNMSRIHNKTVIIVTHNAVLADVADKVIRVKNGQIVSITTNDNPMDVKEVNY